MSATPLRHSNRHWRTARTLSRGGILPFQLNHCSVRYLLWVFSLVRRTISSARTQ
jgi:hypothetical protein